MAPAGRCCRPRAILFRMLCSELMDGYGYGLLIVGYNRHSALVMLLIVGYNKHSALVM